MIGTPTLAVVSGPPGSGKTTLAHAVAERIGCPAICRDEIKEGLVHASPAPAAGQHELNLHTLTTFFDVLELLLRAGVTTVAEAAFQDRLWRPGLERLTGLAEIRIVHCVTDPETAARRIRERHRENPLRQAHSDHGTAIPSRPVQPFQPVSISAPSMRVDTTDGYRPGIDEIAAFLNGRA